MVPRLNFRNGSGVDWFGVKGFAFGFRIDSWKRGNQMKIQQNRLKRYGVFAGSFLAILMICVIAVRAQTPAPPYALFQYASLTGSGNTITATQVPVVTATGVTVYENLTLQFNVDSNGNLTLAPGYPQSIPAPAILTSGFKPGTYVGPSNVLAGKALITVSGPGVSAGGATTWSLSAAPGA